MLDKTSKTMPYEIIQWKRLEKGTNQYDGSLQESLHKDTYNALVSRFGVLGPLQLI
jgi:hypothetical protein